jgi:hypothetical protein
MLCCVVCGMHHLLILLIETLAPTLEQLADPLKNPPHHRASLLTQQ